MHIPIRCHRNRTASFIFEKIWTNDTERWYPRPYCYSLTVNLFHMQSIRISFTAITHVLFIHASREFEVTSIWYYQATNNIGVFVHYGNKLHIKSTSWSKIRVWQFLYNESFVGVKTYIRLKYPLVRSARYVARNWMSMYWAFGATSDSCSYSFGVFRCPHSSDCSSGSFIFAEAVVLDGAAIRSRSVSHS